MRTYLVTGGAGFIGSTVVERLLKENNKVIVVDNFNNYYDSKIKEKNISTFIRNKNFKLYFSDIRNRKEIERVFDENNIDVVIHLAAMAGVRSSIEDPILYQEVNCMGTQIILEEAKLHNVRNIIMASSSSVYGNYTDVPFREDMNVDYVISPYAATKKENEEMAYVYHKLNDMNIIVLRLFSVYGPRQRPDLAISKFTTLMINNKSIPMYGDGTTLRDYTYIDDIVDGIIKACDYVINNNDVYEIINLGRSNPIELREMIRILEEQLNMKAKIRNMPIQQGDVDRTYADITKARKLLKYNPKTNINEGIKKYIEWYKKNGE